MSLINDALKRASQADRQRAPTPAQTPPAMVPAHPPARSSHGGLLVTLLIFAFVALAGAASLVLLRVFRSKPQQHQSPPLVVAPQPAPAPVPIQPAPAAIRPPAPTPPALPPPQLALAPSSPPPPPPAAPPPPAFPTLKLQAIFYSKSSPRALINGRTAAIGDIVAETRIKEISPDKVTVEWRGQTKSLSLGAP